jgi:hypothetical protein
VYRLSDTHVATRQLVLKGYNRCEILKNCKCSEEENFLHTREMDEAVDFMGRRINVTITSFV